jgi:HAD superfamily 5'-nucleotidase-like hydrolase
MDVELLLKSLRDLSQSQIERPYQIYCNRDLDLQSVQAIGFDMDYTLAVYKQDAMDELSMRLTLQNLVAFKGYPQEILAIKPRPEYAIRGLVVDKERGNLLKIDSHRHVGRAYHGFRQLTWADLSDYRQDAIRFNSDRFALMDTLYALPEAFAYAALVDYFERTAPGQPHDWRRLYEDVRFAIDRAHAEGDIKDAIMADPRRFVHRSEELALALHRFRLSGKQLFLLTNSYPLYTDFLMTYLLDGLLPEYPSWRDYFDIAIAGAKKPSFFDSEAPFLVVDADERPIREEHTRLDPGVVYQGGNFRDFTRLSRFEPARVVYMGDHIYGDILRSRKSSAWRAVMIVQEMEQELLNWSRLRPALDALHDQEEHLARLTQELAYDQWMLDNLDALLDQSSLGGSPLARSDARQTLEDRIRANRDKRESLLLSVIDQEEQIEAQFHPCWGMVFKTGNKNSIFGEQVEDYACLYTSKVANFVNYSPFHYFRAPRQPMPHEMR